MKVARICQEYLPLRSGPIKQAHAIMRQLHSAGVENRLVSTTLGTGHNRFTIEELEYGECIRLPVRGRLLRYHFLKNPRLVREYLQGSDLVHVHGWRNHVSDLAISQAKAMGIPVVLHAHGGARAQSLANGPIAKFPYVAYDVLFRKRILGVDAVVVSTRQESCEAAEYGFPARVRHVIPAGVKIDAGSPIQGARQDSGAVSLLFVGRLSRGRQVEKAIKLLAHVRVYTSVPVRLRIVGAEAKSTSTSRGGYLIELQRLAQILGVASEVDFVGEKVGSDLDAEYAGADIFIHTSGYENFGNAVLEAAAAGLPLLATDTGVATTLVNDAQGGLFFTGDVQKDAASLLRFIREPSLRRQLGANGRRHARRAFSWRSVGNMYVSLYRSLVHESRSPVARD